MAYKRTREASLSDYSIHRWNHDSDSPIRRWNHDVFLSFSEDTGNKTIIDGLYNALVERGIRTFRENDEQKRGEKSIEESRIAIVVFSRKYVTSIWCLDELVKILDCRKRLGLTLVPVFSGVDPTDIRNQKGIVGEAFARHGENFKDEKEKVESWREALTKTSNLSGWDLGHEEKFIQRIVEDLLPKLSRKPLNVASYAVGLESRVMEMNAFLRFYSSDVRIVGICGIGGLGKTTIAKAVYNEIYYRFEGCSFLENVREVSKQPNGLIHLQEKLLSDVLMKSNLKISTVARGINEIRQRLCNKRVIVVIDDVDQLDQLNALAINCDSFGMGSRIIVISRDEHFLNGVGVNVIYNPLELDPQESLQLFSLYAFRNDCPPEDYMELSKDMVGYVKGLPLALKVIGSLMFDKRSSSEWKNALAKLRSIPDDQIQEKLRLSFDDLDDTEKDIFLDIACFLIGMDKDYVIMILDGCEFFPAIGISVLTKKSLITIDERKKIRMHDLLRDMGKYIVHEESPTKPGRRTRLWSLEDVCEVLANNEGTESVEGLVLNMFNFEDGFINAEAFANMHRIRLLQLNYVYLRGEYVHLSKKLRWLCWHGFPLNSIPSDFDMDNLVVLDMQNSKLKEVWKEIKQLRMLKILNLSHSHHMVRTPNFSGLPNLEKLILLGCSSLVEIHGSIGFLDKLVVLDLEGCHNLIDLPNSICNLRSLEMLNLSGCSKQVRSQEHLGTVIREPKSIPLLPASLSGLRALRVLYLTYCNLSEDLIPNDFGSLSSSLKYLYLDGNRFCTLPTSIGCLSRLSALSLEKCKNLQQIMELPSSLRFLNLANCPLLERLPGNISDDSGLLSLDLKTDGSTSSQEVANVGNLPLLNYLLINYDLFCSISHKIKDDSRLLMLSLVGCERPQTLPKLPSRLCSLHVEGDIRGEIQSLETSQSVQGIHMEAGCYDLGNTLRKKSLFQGLCRRFEVWGTGSEIPKWVSHQNRGSSISFEVSLCSGCKIEGMDVAAVFAAETEAKWFRSKPIIRNKTKGIQWGPLDGFSQRTRHRQLGKDVLWVRHLPMLYTWRYKWGNPNTDGFGAHFEVGDQVEVSVEFVQVNDNGEPVGGVQVKKCGALLVHKLEETQFYIPSGAQSFYYRYPEDVFVDGERSVRSIVAYIEDQSQSSHNNYVAGSSIDAKRSRIG